MAKPADDLDAVRQVAELLESFAENDRERIIRWTRERLGMQAAPTAVAAPAPAPAGVPAPTAPVGATDIKTFLAQKDPKSERQLVAAVAYYYRFVAPQAERKESIGADDVVEACRKGDRARPKNALMALNNSFSDGYVDRVERGQYKINSVGENLVAMVLPGVAAAPRIAPRKGPSKPKAKAKAKR